MNEERKPKKLNIKKIAVVALSVIMIMTTFCLSAFADNPLMSKSEYILGQTEIASFDPPANVESDIYNVEFEINELNVTVSFIDENGNEFSSRGITISMSPQYTYLSFMNTNNEILTYELNIAENSWQLDTNNKYIIIGGTDSDGGELSAEEVSTIVNDAVTTLILTIPNSNIQDMFINVKVINNSSQGILSTFLGVGTWISGAVSALIGMFYLNGSLTFIGYLAVAALAVSVVFLLIYLISSFLKFRG